MKAASRKGLGATIREIEGEKEGASRELERPVEPVLAYKQVDKEMQSKPVVPVLASNQFSSELQGEFEGVRVRGDVISHLDNLEAEIWAVLEETESLNIPSDPVSNVGVAMGGATPNSNTKGAGIGKKIEVKKLANPPVSNKKKVKVTSVQINARRSSQSEERRKVQSQSQPVSQDPKPETSKNQPPQVVGVQDHPPVKLRCHREPLVSVKTVVKETRPTKQSEKTIKIKQSEKTAPRNKSSM